MKKVLFFASLFTAMQLFSQGTNLLQFPPYLQTGRPGPAIGEVLSDTLWNTGTTPAKFYILFNPTVTGSPKSKYVFLNDSMHLEWLKAQSNAASPDERRLQYVLAEAKFQKTISGRGPLISDPEHVTDPKVGYTVLQSITGSGMAIQYKQGKMYCHQVLTNVTALAAKDTACQPKYFRVVSLPNHHLAEVMYKGRWVAVDPNGSTPGLVFKNNNGGYYSTEELLNDTARIYPDYKVVNTRGERLYKTTPADVSMYRWLFDKREVTTTPFEPKETEKVSGEIILPPGGALVFSYTNGLSIDTATTTGKQYVQKLLWLQERCSAASPAYCDSFLNLIARQEGVTLTQAKDVVYSGKVVFYNGAARFAPFLFEGTGAFPFHPTVQLLVPPHSSPLVIGSDVKAPFLMLDSTFSLWNNKLLLTADKNKVKYLQSGVIAPSGVFQNINLSLNLNVVNWLGGLTIDQLGSPDSLVIARKQVKLKPGSPVQSKVVSAGANIITPQIVKNK